MLPPRFNTPMFPLPSVHPLSLLARPVPYRLQAMILERALEQAFHDRIADGEMDFLAGHVIAIHITDADLQWPITLAGEPPRLRLRRHAQPDVTIAGTVGTFVLLAARSEDPDTLFFERRLTVAGDTELGLRIKNLLDSVDLDELPALLRTAVVTLGRAHARGLLPN